MSTQDSQYELSTDGVQANKDRLSNWLNGIGFRMLVYVGFLMFTVTQLAVFSELYDAGLMSGSQNAFEFVFGLFGLITIAMLLSDFVKGGTYLLRTYVPKHRGYLAAAVVVTVLFGLEFSTNSLSGDHAEAYRKIAWAMAFVVAAPLLSGGIYKEDLKRLQQVVLG